MKRNLFLCCLFIVSSCFSERLLYDSSTRPEASGRILEQTTGENSNKEYGCISGWVLSSSQNGRYQKSSADLRVLTGVQVYVFSNSNKSERGFTITNSSKSDDQFSFEINNLSEGYYEIQFLKKDFHTFRIDSLYLGKGVRIFLEVELKALPYSLSPYGDYNYIIE